MTSKNLDVRVRKSCHTKIMSSCVLGKKYCVDDQREFHQSRMRREVVHDDHGVHGNKSLINQQEESNQIERAVNLLELPWMDIIFGHILCHLSWQDLFHVRSLSRKSDLMIQEYFKELRVIDLSSRTVSHLHSCKSLNIDRNQNSKALFCHEDNFSSGCDANRDSLTGAACGPKFSLVAFSLVTREVNMSRIRVLNLSRCKWISNRALINLPLQDLLVLDVSGCFEVRRIGAASFLAPTDDDFLLSE